MHSFNDALQIVLEHARRELPAETVPLVLALGRTLAVPVVSSENIPAHANSAMDGYAVIASDVKGASAERPVRLKVIGESAAGRSFNGTVGTGCAARIMTGGLVPDGADAVVEVESTTEEGGMVMIRREVPPGWSIRPAGEDIRDGEIALPAGRRVTPGDIGVLASLGVTNVPVRVAPSVGILSTGTEIVEPSQRPRAGEVRNSSAPALFASCAAAGAEPVLLGIVGDDPEDLREMLEQGLRYDILITTGGVSAGAYDHVQHLLPELGVRVLFHRIAIKPGKPVLFGSYTEGASETLVFGLPGNPVSSLVTFRELVAPAIASMLGRDPEGGVLRLRARLSSALAKRDDLRHFQRGMLVREPDGELTVAPTRSQSSGVLSSMSVANCLIILEESNKGANVGDEVEVEML